MSDYDDTNRLAVFKNKNMREGKKDAPFTGTLNVDGIEYFVNMWNGTDKNGNTYLSGSVRKKDKQPDQQQPEAASAAADFDDEIPF